MHSLNTASEYFFEVESFDSGLDYFYPRSEEVNGTGGEVEINKRTPGQRGGGYGGTTDTEEVYFKVGRMNLILDNLIAAGKAKEMIIVMPYANPYIEMMRQGLADRYDSMDTDRVAAEIINDVKPFIEANYKVKTSARDRAVAGFSLGGRQIEVLHTPGHTSGSVTFFDKERHYGFSGDAPAPCL